ncbi:MAG TPA: hypothetical protein VL972_07080 [Solirubrobacteraceae bacterium]|nr:hypothetical protein [Solirubrobacteraceae bacterium]
MVPRVGKASNRVRLAIVCAVLAALAGGIASARSGLSGSASASSNPPRGSAAAPAAQRDGQPPSHGGTPRRAKSVSSECAATVTDTLGQVAERVYHEGVASERTGTAASFIARSIPLREAVEREEGPAARIAARALLATGHLTNLEVTRNGRVLASVGPARALAPLRGSILDAAGAPIASYVASVWTDDGLVDETNGIAQGMTELRQDGRDVAGSLRLPGRALPAQGQLTASGVRYRFTSFPASAYPGGEGVRVYVLKALASMASLCGSSQRGTLVNTLGRVASLIYAGEVGNRAQVQVRRVQHNEALLRAVAAREPEATRLAIDKLLNEHIVRLRASAGGQLLSDVGGPFVLGPVRAPLRWQGRRIGSFVLSIQDDIGYLKLADRLAGLKVAMYREGRLVMSSLRPAPERVPASGSFAWDGRSYGVYTVHAQAFPAGALRIAVLIPLPYA